MTRDDILKMAKEESKKYGSDEDATIRFSRRLETFVLNEHGIEATQAVEKTPDRKLLEAHVGVGQEEIAPALSTDSEGWDKSWDKPIAQPNKPVSQLPLSKERCDYFIDNSEKAGPDVIVGLAFQASLACDLEEGLRQKNVENGKLHEQLAAERKAREEINRHVKSLQERLTIALRNVYNAEARVRELEAGL